MQDCKNYNYISIENEKLRAKSPTTRDPVLLPRCCGTRGGSAASPCCSSPRRSGWGCCQPPREPQTRPWSQQQLLTSSLSILSYNTRREFLLLKLASYWNWLSTISNTSSHTRISQQWKQSGGCRRSSSLFPAYLPGSRAGTHKKI